MNKYTYIKILWFTLTASSILETDHIMTHSRFTLTVANEILEPKAKYDGKVEVMDSFWASAYEKVNKVGNLGEQ